MAPAVRIENLSKLYRIGARQQAHYRTLRESLMDAAAAPWRRWQTLRNQSRIAADELNGQANHAHQVSAKGQVATNGHALSNGQAVLNGHAPTSGQTAASNLPPAPLTALPDTIWALNDVSFDVQHGEVVGIIGRNGAGKSTLLKILSRITEPTRGRVVLKGRVASLLEVGTGFHPELTGRENIYLNGAILGMHRHEIKCKFDAIVDFSGIEKFLDTPVKRYSSGMYVRLAFAVAAHLDPEILIVDEVLAVGDAAFQKKCLQKMRSVAQAGHTVLFVTHNLSAFSQLCSKGIVLRHGKMAFLGGVHACISSYSDELEATQFKNEAPQGAIYIERAHVVGSSERTNSTFRGNDLIFEIVVHNTSGESDIALGISIETSSLVRVIGASGLSEFNSLKCLRGTNTYRITLPRLPLNQGLYFATLAIHDWTTGSVVDRHDACLSFEIVEPSNETAAAIRTANNGLIVWNCIWETVK
jgi:lipopolysaccharide transport system ATP-binding protein